MKELAKILIYLEQEDLGHFYLRSEYIYIDHELKKFQIGGFMFPPIIGSKKENGNYTVKIQRWPTLIPPELYEFHQNCVNDVECNPFKFDVCSLGILILNL